MLDIWLKCMTSTTSFKEFLNIFPFIFSELVLLCIANPWNLLFFDHFIPFPLFPPLFCLPFPPDPSLLTTPTEHFRGCPIFSWSFRCLDISPFSFFPLFLMSDPVEGVDDPGTVPKGKGYKRNKEKRRKGEGEEMEQGEGEDRKRETKMVRIFLK